MNWVQHLREMGSEGAPGYVETRLRAAFREQHNRRRSWLPLTIAAAMASVIVAIGYWRVGGQEPVAQPPVLTAHVAVPQSALAKAVVPVVARPPRPARTRELATDFFPLQYLPDARTLANGNLVRVSMPRAAMATFGFPVDIERRQERVQADVLLGGDGMAHAIRFVQPSRY